MRDVAAATKNLIKQGRSGQRHFRVYPRNGPSRASGENVATAVGGEMKRARTPNCGVNLLLSCLRDQNQLSMCRLSDDVDIRETSGLIEVRIEWFAGSPGFIVILLSANPKPHASIIAFM